MKKSLITAAIMAFAGAASAQSAVTLWGIVDASVVYATGSGTGKTSRYGLASSGRNSSQLGFRGTEDLGGGLAAGFWLESGILNDDGTGLTGGALSFNRRSTVSLMGPFGEIRLGRDYAPTFTNFPTFDPWGGNGLGAGLLTGLLAFTTGGQFLGGTNPGAAVRNNNSLGYILPKTLGGFYGTAQYAFGEVGYPVPAGTSNQQKNYWGARLGYENAALNTAFAYGVFKGTTSALDLKVMNAGISYTLPMVKLAAQWDQEKQTGVKVNAFEIAATAPVGAGEIRGSASWYRPPGPDNDSKKFALGYGYNLSKRTQLYTTVAYVTNQSGAKLTVSAPSIAGFSAVSTQLGKSSSGIEFGIRHMF